MMNLKQPLNQTTGLYNMCTKAECASIGPHTTFKHTTALKTRSPRFCWECFSEGYHKSYCTKGE